MKYWFKKLVERYLMWRKPEAMLRLNNWRRLRLNRYTREMFGASLRNYLYEDHPIYEKIMASHL